MITAVGTPEAVLGALRQKVCDFLVKPFSVADISAAVRSAIDEHSTLKIRSYLGGAAVGTVACAL